MSVIEWSEIEGTNFHGAEIHGWAIGVYNDYSGILAIQGKSYKNIGGFEEAKAKAEQLFTEWADKANLVDKTEWAKIVQKPSHNILDTYSIYKGPLEDRVYALGRELEKAQKMVKPEPCEKCGNSGYTLNNFKCKYSTGCVQTKMGDMPMYYEGICEERECQYYQDKDGTSYVEDAEFNFCPCRDNPHSVYTYIKSLKEG